jgi:outer membrane protein assembly factor BamB
MKKYILSIAVLALVSTLGLAVTSARASEAESILKTTGLKGGICLVIGDDSLSLAKQLASKSQLYVQVLQPDLKKAAEWSKEISQSPLRTKLGVRNAVFKGDHYGSDLLNLILVRNQKALNGVKPGQLVRILVPRGFLFSKLKLAGLSDKGEKVSTLPAKGSWGLICQKKVSAIEWKPADSLKWRAGPRAHINLGFMGVVHGSGKFIYRELMEASDSFPKVRTRVLARDGFNGRTLWSLEEPVGFTLKSWRAGQYSRPGLGMALDEANQFFYITHDKKLLCLDAETGKQKFVLLSAKAGWGYLTVLQNKYLIHQGVVYSTKTGKKLYRLRGRYVFHQDKIFVLDGSTFKVRKLVDGSEVLSQKQEWLDAKIAKGMGVKYLAGRVILTQGGRWKRPFVLTAIDPATGKKAWTHKLEGLFELPPRAKKPGDKTYSGTPTYFEYDNKILVYASTRHYYGDGNEAYITRLDPASGKVEKQGYGYKGKLFGSNCNNGIRMLGDYFFYWHNVWFNLKTEKRSFPYLIHPGCFLPTSVANGYLYNVPSRKGGSIQGITAIGPADIAFDQKVGGSIVKTIGPRPAFKDDTKDTDWPMYRQNGSRSNSVSKSSLGTSLEVAWTAEIGIGGSSYGVMSGTRTGLTQATVAYGLAYVADIDAQSVVATDIKSGKTAWSYSLGSRVDFPPAIYKGLCLVAAKDGWVYCLNAKTGDLVYKVLTAPRERLIGGQEKLESLWPPAADVFVQGGLAYVSNGFTTNIHGGSRYMAFEVETGKTKWAKCLSESDSEAGYPRPHHVTGLFTGDAASGSVALRGKALDVKTGLLARGAAGLFLRGSIDDLLGFGNSMGRTNEDRAHALFSDGRARGRSLAFDKALSVAYTFKPKGESFVNTGRLHIKASRAKKQTAWSTEAIELIVDDIVLTPKFVYAVGHYYRTKGKPELWVLSREDGKILNKYPVDGFPSFGGMSVAGDRLLVATREGKLICFKTK